MATQTAQTTDEAEIRKLIADEAAAICAKDLDRIMAPYARDFIFFDVKPPFQAKGAAALRRNWEACLPYFPKATGTEMRDLNVTVSGDLALAHWLSHFTGIDKDHPAANLWMRNTVGYRKIQGRWQIVHAHVSVPFDPATSMAVFTLEP